MPLIVGAIYENGVLKPTHPLPLKENERVQVSIHTLVDIRNALEAVRTGRSAEPRAPGQGFSTSVGRSVAFRRRG